MIEVEAYNPKWPEIFSGEVNIIKGALGENCVAVHHIGSTSVEGLIAKPKIDIIVVVKDSSIVTEVFEKLGYTAKGELNLPLRLYFSKDEPHKINLHLFEEGDARIKLNLMFRDYLRAHPEACKEYAKLKTELLAKEESHEKGQYRLTKYTLGKNKFIKKILKVTGFDELHVAFCIHYDEWETVKNFRQKYFFDKKSIKDPYTWTFDHKDHVHFVLYKGASVIGYAHLQLWKNGRVALRIIVIDELYRTLGAGKYLLNLCERWLRQRDVKTLHIQSSPEALSFYIKHNYVEMPFDDPDGYEVDSSDIEIGKVL
ncbi:MAG: GNAT family N-acetyltransferase [Alphaproteobacteria bacterium]|nr:MAG: GNAT family N-acetyltransferase [Alphaproteobacteria bacterium]